MKTYKCTAYETRVYVVEYEVGAETPIQAFEKVAVGDCITLDSSLDHILHRDSIAVAS